MAYERKTISSIKWIFEIFISIFLIALQLVIYYLLFVGIRTIPYIYMVFFILAIILVIRLFNSSDNISYKLAWTIIILLFNVSGSILYLLFGRGHSLPKRKYRKIAGYLNKYVSESEILKEVKEVDQFGHKSFKLLNAQTGLYPYRYEDGSFYSDGKKMFDAMIESIDNAKKYIFMEFFIIASGKMLDRLIEHLVEASQRGVEIKIIYDYVGCHVPKVLKKEDKIRIESIPNCKFVTYNPISIKLNLGINYRDHRKILLVDGLESFVGGINIADEYIHEKERFGYWRDNGMKLVGEASYNYLLIFLQNWFMSTKEPLDIEKYRYKNKKTNGNGYVFPFGDGPSQKTNPAYDLFTQLISNAKESILISTPYFVIDTEFVKNLINAIKSGVNVKILIPGIADKKIVKFMATKPLKEIVLAGGEVYEFKPGFNHAKTVMIDSQYAVLGTINIDYRSLFLHFECANYMVLSPIIKEIEDDFYKDLAISRKIEIKDLKKENIFKRFIRFLLSLFTPLI